MKKIIRIFIILFIAINILSVNALAKDFSYIEESLNNLGIDEEYSENIVEYLNKLEISETQYNEIVENTTDIVEAFSENTKYNIENFDFFQYYTLYGKVMNITEILDLGLDVNLNDKSFMLLDKNTKNILYEGDVNSISELYSNYKKMNTSIDITEIVEEVKKDDIENEIKSVNEKNYNNISNNKNIENNKNISEATDKKNEDILDKYIEKFDKYNETMLVEKSNNVDWKVILTVFIVVLIIFTIINVISIRKRLQ